MYISKYMNMLKLGYYVQYTNITHIAYGITIGNIKIHSCCILRVYCFGATN